MQIKIYSRKIALQVQTYFMSIVDGKDSGELFI